MLESANLSLIQQVVAVLEEERCRFALIGAMAMLAHNAPRTTLDIDLLTTETRTLRFAWSERLASDVKIDARTGDYDDPLAGVISFDRGGEPTVDLVIGRWKWQERAIECADPVQILGVTIPVVTPAHLVLTKLDAGGPRDLLDVELLLDRHDGPLLDAVRDLVPGLPSNLQHVCEAFLRRMGGRETQ